MLDLLGEAAVRTFLLAGVVACGLRLLRVRQPQLRLAAWTIVLVTSISMPMLTRLAPWRVVTPVFPTAMLDGAGDALVGTAMQMLPTVAPPEEPPQRPLRWWLEVIYVVVAVAIAARVLVGVALSLRLLARSAPVHAEWGAGMRVRISREVASPVTVARTILLPLDAASWSADTRRAVLAHERAHVARWDFAMLVLAQLNRALFWFSPLSWWLHRRLVVWSELASDDQAMAVTRDRLFYAEILLEMGRRSGPVLRGPAMARRSTLASRIERILDEPLSQPVDPALRLALAAVVTGLSLAAASLVVDPVPPSDIVPLQQQLTTKGADPLDPPSSSVAETASHEPPIERPTFEAETALKPLSRVAFVRPTLPAVSTQRSLSGARPPQPKSSKTVARVAPAPPPRPSTEATEWAGSQADARILSPLPPTSIQAFVPPQRSLDVEDIMRSTCTGTIAVGLRARQYTHPDVVAGQTVEAEARFFRKEDGASWVRFFAFGRPPLDLPVRLTQGRITWTGEYGIAYAVQPVGGDHLVGLAAQVAFDSAQLEFTCRKPNVRPL